MLTRRNFSKLMAAAPLLGMRGLEQPSSAPASPPQDMSQALSQSRDLLIKGGTVVDPSQKLHALLDVAVKDGKIQQIAPDISAGRSAERDLRQRKASSRPD